MWIGNGRNCSHMRRARLVLAGDLHRVPQRRVGFGDLANGLRRAAIGGIQTADDMEELQRVTAFKGLV